MTLFRHFPLFDRSSYDHFFFYIKGFTCDLFLLILFIINEASENTFFGYRNDVEVKFPLVSGPSNVPAKYIEAQDMIRKLKWESIKLIADIQRELPLLDYEEENSQVKREKFV